MPAKIRCNDCFFAALPMGMYGVPITIVSQFSTGIGGRYGLLPLSRLAYQHLIHPSFLPYSSLTSGIRARNFRHPRKHPPGKTRSTCFCSCCVQKERLFQHEKLAQIPSRFFFFLFFFAILGTPATVYRGALWWFIFFWNHTSKAG